MRISLICILVFFSLLLAKAQTPQEQKEFWKTIAKELPEFKKVFKKHEKYRFEIIYGEINHAPGHTPQINKYYFGNSNTYFYPASTVKLPIALRSMQLVHELSEKNNLSESPYYISKIDSSICGGYKGKSKVNKFLRITHPISAIQAAATCELNAEQFYNLNQIEPDSNLLPGTFVNVTSAPESYSLEDMMSEMLIYSNNNFYNILFELANHQQCEAEKNAKISTRFHPCIGTNVDSTGFLQIAQPQSNFYFDQNSSPINDRSKKIFTQGYKVGKRYINAKGETIKSPIDFSRHNAIQLEFIMNTIAELVYPGYLPSGSFYNISESQRKNIIRYLGMRPDEDKIVSDTSYLNLPDNFTNYLYTGQKPIDLPESIRIINIVGQSYGFITDCMYFIDKKEKIDFFLAARIYVNKDKTLNDDKYEYHEIAFPLFEKLGKAIYNHEKKREKGFLINPGQLFQIFE